MRDITSGHLRSSGGTKHLCLGLLGTLWFTRGRLPQVQATLQSVSITLSYFFHLLGLFGPLQPERRHFPSVWGLLSVDSAAGLLRGGISSDQCHCGRPKTVVARHIYYDQGSDIKVKQCKTIVTFDTILESKILNASNLLILLNLQKPWTIACKDISRVFEIEYSTYRILNRPELCKCSLTAGNYLLSYTNINCGNIPEARDGYFTTYYSFNKIVLDVITEKFDIQVDENTRNQAALLHDDIPGYDLPTIDFVNTTTDQDEDISILEEDNSQIYAYLNNV